MSTLCMIAVGVDDSFGDCRHDRSEEGESGKLSRASHCRDRRAMPGAMSVPERLSQGHIPVPWVMAACLDVVLIKLPSGSLTKCSMKNNK